MEIADQIIEQLRQLQVMMQRIAFHCTGSTPYRGRGRILSLLRETPVTSQKELANQLDISKQALAELLLKMERAGLITREAADWDRRVQKITLTEAGKLAADQITAEQSALPGLLVDLNPEERKSLHAMLDRIVTRAVETDQRTTEEFRNRSACNACGGPENCTQDYLKYGHTEPDPAHCRFVRGNKKGE